MKRKKCEKKQQLQLIVSVISYHHHHYCTVINLLWAPRYQDPVVLCFLFIHSNGANIFHHWNARITVTPVPYCFTLSVRQLPKTIQCQNIRCGTIQSSSSAFKLVCVGIYNRSHRQPEIGTHFVSAICSTIRRTIFELVERYNLNLIYFPDFPVNSCVSNDNFKVRKAQLFFSIRYLLNQFISIIHPVANCDIQKLSELSPHIYKTKINCAVDKLCGNWLKRWNDGYYSFKTITTRRTG